MECFKNFDPGLALKLAKIAHDQCKNVPHDIGIQLAEAVAKHHAEIEEEANAYPPGWIAGTGGVRDH